MTKLMDLREERFCQAFVKGGTQADAYRIANPLSKRWKPQTISNKASDMMALEVVKERIRVLRGCIETKVIEQFVKSKSDVLNKLESLIKVADDHLQEVKDKKETIFKFPLKDYIKEVRESLKEQAKILGYYEETHKHIGDPNNPINHQLIVQFIGVDK